MKLHSLRKADWFIGMTLALILAPITRGLGSILRRNHDLAANKRIVVLKLLGGGNFAIALPLLLGLRKHFPKSEMIAVVTPSTVAFAQAIGVFDTIRVLETRSFVGLIASAWKTLVSIFNVDVVIDLEIHSKLTTCFGLFTCARNRLGFFTSDFFLREYLYTHLVFFNPQACRPALFQHFALIMGAAAATSDECREHLRQTLGYRETRGNTIGVGVGCSDLGLVRKLTAGQWQLVLRRVLEERRGTEVMFFGSAEDRALADEVIAGLGREFPGEIFHNFCGERSLTESLRMLAECGYYLGIDSALLHFARLFHVPSESFWGPTDPYSLLLPIEGYVERIHHKPLACSPCIHVAENAPCRGRNLCIQGLFSDRPISFDEALSNTTTSPEDKCVAKASVIEAHQ